MSLDERIEALRRTVELLASRHQDHQQMFLERQKQIDQMFQPMATQFQSMATQFQGRDEQFNERFQANEVRLAQLMDTMNRLARILEVHDQVIDEHERRLEDLDKPRH